MTESNVYLYEGLFLFNIQAINGNLNTAIQHVTEILNRAEAEIIAISKWDERKMAFEVAGQKRGLYLLAHFKVRGTQLANIERDINLSELLMRGLILRAEHVGEIEMEQVLAEAAKTRDAVALDAAAKEPKAAEVETVSVEAPAAETVSAETVSPETDATDAVPADADTDTNAGAAKKEYCYNTI